MNRRRAERELEAELRFHLEMEADKHVRAGMSPHDARRTALVAFGGVERFKEESRDARGTRSLERLGRDVRYALRRLLRQPGFSIAAVTTVALGIGAVAAIVGLVGGVLLRPLPYPAADRLVLVRHTAPGLGVVEAGQSDGTYLHYRGQNRVFDEIGTYFDRELTLTDRDEPERIQAALTTPSIFWVLGVKPQLGRLFSQADVENYRGSPTAVLLSHGLWVRRYGADPDIVGQWIELNRLRRQIVGVMGPDFAFPEPSTQLWYAMPVERTTPKLQSLYQTSIARLKHGVSRADAEADVQRLVRSLGEAYPDAGAELLRDAQLRAVVVPLKEALIADVRQALVLLLVTTGSLLLIALANVVNLFLARAQRLRREVAVQRALGASEGDLARRFLSEGILVAAVGGALAMVLASLGVALRFGFEPGQIPRLHEVRVDWIILVVASGLALLTGFLLGGASLASAARLDVPTALKGAVGRVTPSRPAQRAQRMLVAVQLAVALTLLIGSATMGRSFWRMKRADLGFDARGLVALDVALPTGAYLEYRKNAAFFERLLEELRTIPGVTAAEAVANAPLDAAAPYSSETVVAEAWASGIARVHPPATMNGATPGYFAAMRIPLARGRALASGDLASDAHPVVISAALARALFNEEEPIGRRIRLAERPRFPWYTVVGVAGSVPSESVASEPAKTVYFPVVNDVAADSTDFYSIPVWPREMTIVVRTRLPAASVVTSVRRIMRAMDRKVPVARVRTMEQVVGASMARARLTMLLLLTAAGCALTLGMIGISAVVSYTVSQRVPEFGVRIALGATAADVHRLVLREGVAVTVTGLAAGLLAASALIGFLRGLLFEVSPRDPASFATMSLLVLLVAALASYIPARRASRVDPVAALRAD